MVDYGDKASWEVVKWKARYGRGQSWAYFIKDMLYVYIAFALLETKYNIDLGLLLFILPFVYIFGCAVIGYIDERRGIWKKEAIWNSKDLNPFMAKIDTKIDGMNTKIDRMIEYEKERNSLP